MTKQKAQQVIPLGFVFLGLGHFGRAFRPFRGR